MKRYASSGQPDLTVGTRVNTVEGYPGVIDDILEGPSDLSTYFVTLDDKQGGGEYAENELTPISSATSAIVPVEATAEQDYPELGTVLRDRPPPRLQTTAAVKVHCSVCDEDYFIDSEAEKHDHSKQAATDKWPSNEPVATYGMTYDGSAAHDPRVIEARAYTGWDSIPVEAVPTNKVVATESVVSAEAIEHFRDLPYKKGKSFQMVDLGNRMALIDGHHRMAKEIRLGSPTVQAQVYRSESHQMAARLRTAIDIPAFPESAITQQFTQYPQTGTGITYFKGEISSDLWVDCLLAYRDGKLVGVLNHFPKDMGPERKGNVNVLVLPAYQRQGIGSALWAEAVKRWDVKRAGQDLTSAGRGFLDAVGSATPGSGSTTRSTPLPPERSKNRTAPRALNQQPGDVVHRDGQAYTVILSTTSPFGGVIVEDFAGDQFMFFQYEIDESTGILDRAAHLALWLPPKPPTDQRASTTPISPRQKQGYDEGFGHGKEGITRDPSTPGDPDYMVGYEIGWAEGVTVYREPASSWDQNELADEQVGGVVPDMGNVMVGAKEGGAVIDWLRGHPQVSEDGWKGIGRTFSYDWCRFRRDSHCWMSKELNDAASKEAGYAIWVPHDRGYCPRVKWKAQQACPIGEPGPHSGQGGLLDATTPWEQGGQHGGVPSGLYRDVSAAKAPSEGTVDLGMPAMPAVAHEARDDAEEWDSDPTQHEAVDHTAVFEVYATWKQVREKAQRIRSEGGVRIVASRDATVVGHIKGDHGVYETEINGSPGRRNVAYWHCGCKWSAYSWGRSGPWKKYEGRMCSHALALQYEAQARSMFGREMRLDEKQPAWMDQTHVHRPGDYDRSLQRYTKKTETFFGKIRNQVKKLFIDDDGKVKEQGSNRFWDTEVIWYPTWDPWLGLDYKEPRTAAQGQEVEIKVSTFPGLMSTMGGPEEQAWVRAESGGKQVGKLSLSRYRADWDMGGRKEGEGGAKKGEPYWYVEGLAVAPEYRRQGIATRMWAAVHERWPDVPAMHGGNLPTEQTRDAKQLTVTLKQKFPGLHFGSVHTASGSDFEAAARAMMKRAETHEVDTTVFMQMLEARYGGELVGLKNKLKKESSLLRKMLAEAHEFGYDAGRTAFNMSDTLRYTLSFPYGPYTPDAQHCLEDLKRARYRLRIKNYWERGDAYNGLNVACHTPKGFPFELQFHTPASEHMKEDIVHPIFEDWRVETNPIKKAHLSYQMRDLFDTVPVPPSVLSITPLKKQPMPDPSLLQQAAGLVPRRGRSADGWAYLMLHDLGGTPTTVIRESQWGTVEVWKEGRWQEDSEYGRYFYLGEPRSDEIEEWEAEEFIAGPDLNSRHGATNMPTKEGSTMDDPTEFGSLFDGLEAVEVRSLYAVRDDEWGVLSDLHDEPEPALPSTDGADEDGDPDSDPDSDADKVARRLAQRLARRFPGIASVPQSALESSGPPESPEERGRRLLAYVDASLAGVQPSGPNPFEHLAAGEDDNEVAAAAANYVATKGITAEAVKTYDLAERNAIINEGKDEDPASNLDRLDITGTHYEQIEAQRSVPEDEDMWMLSGDPNLGDI